MLHVIRVHRLDLLTGRGTEDLDDLDELIDARLAGEERLSQHQLRHDTTGRPHVCAFGLDTLHVQKRQKANAPMLVV